VHKVVLPVEAPVGLGVGDEEVAVGWYPRGLDRGEVGAEDVGGGVGVGELDGPLSGAFVFIVKNLSPCSSHDFCVYRWKGTCIPVPMSITS